MDGRRKKNIIDDNLRMNLVLFIDKMLIDC